MRPPEPSRGPEGGARGGSQPLRLGGQQGLSPGDTEQGHRTHLDQASQDPPPTGEPARPTGHTQTWYEEARGSPAPSGPDLEGGFPQHTREGHRAPQCAREARSTGVIWMAVNSKAVASSPSLPGTTTTIMITLCTPHAAPGSCCTPFYHHSQTRTRGPEKDVPCLVLHSKHWAGIEATPELCPPCFAAAFHSRAVSPHSDARHHCLGSCL